ncbi:MAG: hypothetical protein HW378_984 [Anaerolineales bacterium]|nr:hypothetical protein [Anaerolineales bacterium]
MRRRAGRIARGATRFGDNGDRDQVCLPGASRYLHAQIADSEIHEFLGAGHAPFLTDTVEFNRRLQAFVAKRSSSRSCL